VGLLLWILGFEVVGLEGDVMRTPDGLARQMACTGEMPVGLPPGRLTSFSQIHAGTTRRFRLADLNGPQTELSFF
jgi:hypothetical protein